jgi:hypothetical protein
MAPLRRHPLDMKLVVGRLPTAEKLTGAVSLKVRLALEPAGSLDCCHEHVSQSLCWAVPRAASVN